MEDRLLAGAVCFFKGLLELLTGSGQPGRTFSWILPYAKYLHFSTKKATIDREKKPLKRNSRLRLFRPIWYLIRLKLLHIGVRGSRGTGRIPFRGMPTVTAMTLL